MEGDRDTTGAGVRPASLEIFTFVIGCCRLLAAAYLYSTVDP